MCPRRRESLRELSILTLTAHGLLQETPERCFEIVASTQLNYLIKERNLIMTYDNHQILTDVVKMLQKQDEPEKSAAFIVAVRDGEKGISVAFNGNGEDCVNITGNIISTLTKTLKDSGLPYDACEDIIMTITMKALEKHYGLEAMFSNLKKQSQEMIDELLKEEE